MGTWRTHKSKDVFVRTEFRETILGRGPDGQAKKNNKRAKKDRAEKWAGSRNIYSGKVERRTPGVG